MIAAHHGLARRRTWRLIGLTAAGVPVAFAGAVTLGMFAGAPLFVLASDVLRSRPEAGAWAAALCLAGFPLSLGVAAADRELCRWIVDPATAAGWTRRPWTWRRLLRLPVDEVSWRRLLWLFLRVLLGLLTAAIGWWTVEGVVFLVAAPFQRPGMLSIVAGCGGLLVLYGLLQAARGTGWLLHQLAAELLGPTPRERIARLEERAVDLEQRARLARELHDSVGHTVTVVVLQAAAARKVLGRDPAFAAEALRVIEEAGRRAVGELADVLRLLRAEAPAGPGDGLEGPGLELLEALVVSTRSAGLPVSLIVECDPDTVPAPVSRVAYRLVQEGCTNVLRHAGAVATEVRLRVDGRWLEVAVHNVSSDPDGSSPRGAGHGLRGLRERVEALGGVLRSGPDGAGFRLTATIPVRGGAAP